MTHTTAGSNPRRESTGRAWRLARKELREILRDRRTVLTLILMPLLVYPLLGSVMSKGVVSSISNAKKLDIHVCFESVREGQLFAAEMLRGDDLLPQSSSARRPADVTEPDSPNSLTFRSEPSLQLSIFILEENNEGRTLEQQVAEGYADLAVRIRETDPADAANELGRRLFQDWDLVKREGSALSERGFDAITTRLEAVNDRYLDRLVSLGRIPPVRPTTIRSRTVESSAPAAAPRVTFIPLVLVLMTMTGAVYPAIDLTAGERERGTMEILVAAPVSRMTLLAGKFLAVLVVALLTASMNLISMFATLFALGLENTILGSLNITVIVQVAVLMMVFAAFFSAVLLSITSVARSFKEAQAYLVPLMLISLTPGVFALLPDVRITGLMAVTPLINTVLMARDLLQGSVDILMFAIVLISTALYGVLALSLAARIFGSDAVLYGSAGTWSDLFRRPAQPLAKATISLALSCLAVLFSLFIIFGPLPSRLQTTLTVQLLANCVVLVTLFVAVPLAFALFARVRLSSGFALQKTNAASWAAAGLLGGSLWTFLYEIQIRSMTEGRVEFLRELFESLELNLTNVPLWVRLLSLAIAPAVCEEFFFRGFLQNSIRSRASAFLAILSSAVLFGLFHVIVKDALLFERLLPSTLMGVVLGIVFERSRSVFPGMFLHVLHNSLLIMISEYQEQISHLGIGMSTQQHLPRSWLTAATVPILAAVFLLSRRKEVRAEESGQQPLQ